MADTSFPPLFSKSLSPLPLTWVINAASDLQNTQMTPGTEGGAQTRPEFVPQIEPGLARVKFSLDIISPPSPLAPQAHSDGKGKKITQKECGNDFCMP